MMQVLEDLIIGIKLELKLDHMWKRSELTENNYIYNKRLCVIVLARPMLV